MMAHSWFQLLRLRVLKSGKAAYDQKFHAGLNIIRGENGSGKSTIADFIFYILGGEFENWKTIAGGCDEVQAEIATQNGIVTLRREIATAQTPMHVFYGPMTAAEQHGLDGWERYSIRRGENRESFSQIMFRAAGIPEAQSQGAANITMHQIMRLLYSDQKTPAALLFRYEPFDTREIREAVGDLICGLSVYELYEIELSLRTLEKQFDEKNRRYTALLNAMPRNNVLSNPEMIDTKVRELTEERARLSIEIESAEDLVDKAELTGFYRERTRAAQEVRKAQHDVESNERRMQVVELEKTDLIQFITYLEDTHEKLGRAERSSEIVGLIEFTHCPACLQLLTQDQGPYHCVLCGKETNPEHEKSRYLAIKTDLEIQIRESRQLLDQKDIALGNLSRETRSLRRRYEERVSDYAVAFRYSTSPSESFVAMRYVRLGQIDSERNELERMRERAIELAALSAEKTELGAKIERQKDRQKALEIASQKRRRVVLTLVSENAKRLLKADLQRQDEFANAQSVAISFGDNSVLVDGELNFAESSNVIVKNSAILSMLISACQDAEFYHPRFVLLDNIEDKGMEQDRSHNFQKEIAKASAAAKMSHQVIFTTSMPNPELDKDDLTIGPFYTHEHRTLAISTPSSPSRAANV